MICVCRFYIKYQTEDILYNMKKQLIHIHGGSPYDSYEDYIESLEEKVIEDPLKVFSNELSWSRRYIEFLHDDWQVIRPDMPCSNNAKYIEWKIWFEKYIPFLQNNIILVGHSLGATFLAKYLSTHTLPVTIEQIHFVAGAYTCEADFDLHNIDMQLVQKQCKNIRIYHSKDDFIVPYSASDMFLQALPKATLVTFTDRGHFLQAEFPELIQNILEIDNI